jgi:hypothetical protein
VRTLRPSCRNSFAVCVFAIEVRFALIFREVAAAFKGDSLFALAAWLMLRRGMRRCTFARRMAFAAAAVAFTVASLRRHLRALLAQNRLP